ncbi:MAG: hypothetical protein PUC41_08080 [Oscillospiraceae bacterium]|nr:hypothetical protein [Oscillospiraceae bacterium]
MYDWTARRKQHAVAHEAAWRIGNFITNAADGSEPSAMQATSHKAGGEMHSQIVSK